MLGGCYVVWGGGLGGVWGVLALELGGSVGLERSWEVWGGVMGSEGGSLRGLGTLWGRDG